MIHQIASIKTKTEPLPPINRGLIQARHIQARLKSIRAKGLPSEGHFWSAQTTGPFIVPVLQWLD